MAKFRYQHIKSSVEGKAPTAAQLKVAEIGVNDFAGDEKLFIKNSEGEVVDFPRGYSRADIDAADRVVAESLNDLNSRKLDASAYTPTDLSDYYTKEEIDEFNETTSASLNDLESRKADKSDVDDNFEVISASLNDLESRKADKGEVDDSFEVISAALNDLEDRKADKSDYYTKSDIDAAERTIAESLNDLNSRKLDASAYTPTDLTNYYTKSETSAATEISSAISGFADSVQYNSTTHYVEFYHGTTAGTKVFEYDASPFLIDGMVESVVITSITSGASTVQVLEITWNSAAGSQVTDIPLSDIFDPDLYYTKSETSGATELSTEFAKYYTTAQTSGATELSTEFAKYYTKSEIDGQLGSGFSQSSVTEVIESNELITSAALNDLNDVKADKEEDLDGLKLKKITQSDYDDLVNAGEIDPNTLYIIID